VYYNVVDRLVSFTMEQDRLLLFFSVGRHSVFLVTARPIENRMFFIRKKEKKRSRAPIVQSGEMLAQFAARTLNNTKLCRVY
jgi:hypothetical protein